MVSTNTSSTWRPDPTPIQQALGTSNVSVRMEPALTLAAGSTAPPAHWPASGSMVLRVTPHEAGYVITPEISTQAGQLLVATDDGNALCLTSVRGVLVNQPASMLLAGSAQGADLILGDDGSMAGRSMAGSIVPSSIPKHASNQSCTAHVQLYLADSTTDAVSPFGVQLTGHGEAALAPGGQVIRFSFDKWLPDETAVLAKVSRVGVLEIFATLALLVAQVRQLTHTAEVSASRLSVWTVSMMTLYDAAQTMMIMVLSLALPQAFAVLATLAFFKMLLFAVFEMRLMVLAHKAQHPELWTGDWSTVRQTLSRLYARFYMLLLLILFAVMFSPSSLLPAWAVLSSLYWVPQILHNATQGTVDSLAQSTLSIHTIARAITPLYLLLCPSSVLVALNPAHQVNLGTGLLIIALLAAQATTIQLQRKWGAQWFVPRAMRPHAYMYFEGNSQQPPAQSCAERQLQLLRSAWATVRGRGNRRAAPYHSLQEQDDVELTQQQQQSATAPRVDAGATTDVEAAGQAVPTCTICLAEVFGDTYGTIMTAPCGHRFHTECLLPWMDRSSVCPTCRAPLPALSQEERAVWARMQA